MKNGFESVGTILVRMIQNGTIGQTLKVTNTP